VFRLINISKIRFNVRLWTYIKECCEIKEVQIKSKYKNRY